MGLSIDVALDDDDVFADHAREPLTDLHCLMESFVRRRIPPAASEFVEGIARGKRIAGGLRGANTETKLWCRHDGRGGGPVVLVGVRARCRHVHSFFRQLGSRIAFLLRLVCDFRVLRWRGKPMVCRSAFSDRPDFWYYRHASAASTAASPAMMAVALGWFDGCKGPSDSPGRRSGIERCAIMKQSRGWAGGLVGVGGILDECTMILIAPQVAPAAAHRFRQVGTGFYAAVRPPNIMAYVPFSTVHGAS